MDIQIQDVQIPEIRIPEECLIAPGDRDRRIKKRFQMEQEVRYKMLYGLRIAENGAGKTLNMSSGGIWFTTETMLTSGMPIELSMTWPLLLNRSCPMKIMIYGCVVRSNARFAAVAIERYEFRTQARSRSNQPALPAGPELPSKPLYIDRSLSTPAIDSDRGAPAEDFCRRTLAGRHPRHIVPPHERF